MRLHAAGQKGQELDNVESVEVQIRRPRKGNIGTTSISSWKLTKTQDQLILKLETEFEKPLGCC
jgi:hypothetical protein